MNNALTRAAAVAAAALGLTFTVATPALASADKCKGDAYASCVAVNGSKLHVSSIKSRVALYAKTCRYGHSQALINGKHYADSNGGKDRGYCSKSIFGAEVTTGTWNVNRNYAKGTRSARSSGGTAARRSPAASTATPASEPPAPPSADRRDR
jgi:hypothetical protein